MTVKLLTEHHLEFLSLTGGCIGWSESTLVKMPHCWKYISRLIYKKSFKKLKVITCFQCLCPDVAPRRLRLTRLGQ